MATHSSILYWEISWTEETGSLHSSWDHAVRHDLATNHNQQNFKDIFSKLDYYLTKSNF